MTGMKDPKETKDPKNLKDRKEMTLSSAEMQSEKH